MTIGIYKIEAICPVARMANQAIYIGQSKNIERRWKVHQKRFPKDQYSYEVILVVPPEHDIDLLERLFIDVYDSHRNGLNKTIGGTAIKAKYPDAETRTKISAAKKGKLFSEETKAKMSEAHKGKTKSEEHKAKLSAATKGKKHKPMSEETKAKMSEAQQHRRERETSSN